nr:uncharacterized protein C1orf109 homolog isoform X1 [Danio rerio]|eukprot:XP_021323656.1 uncharacterized protein C1orf109 homolog isoform X1 [Danio rerio]
MPGSALLSLQQELRRGFEALKAAKDAFDGGHAECQELVSSLGNLALQLKALKQVQISKTPLSGFPCLQQRLHYKLSLAVDALLAKLAEKILMQSRLLLQTLTPTDLTSMETAPNRWRSLRSARQEERIADALCQVSIFLETE